MTDDAPTNTNLPQLAEVATVVRDPLHFKYKLDIGEDAFQSLRLKKYLLDAVDAGNGAIVGFGAAKSSFVASTFFAPSGFLGAIGVTTAATPLGWAIAAGVIGAGLSLVIGKQFVRGTSSEVRSIPSYINTPMDLLAIGLFDLMGMLSVKLALVDGSFAESERQRIRDYFVEEWGYDETFVDAGIREIEAQADNHTIKDVAEQLANFKKENPDCNYETMAKEVVAFLHELSQADGVVDEREEMAIEKVQTIFDEANSFKVGAVVSGTLDAVAGVGKRTAENVNAAVTKVSDVAKQTLAKRQSDEDEKR